MVSAEVLATDGTGDEVDCAREGKLEEGALHMPWAEDCDPPAVGMTDENAPEVPLSAEEEGRARRARREARERAAWLKGIDELAEREWGTDWKSQLPPPFDWAQRAEPTELETPSLKLLELFEEELEGALSDVHDDVADGEGTDGPGEQPGEISRTESDAHQAEPSTFRADGDTVYGLYARVASPPIAELPSPKNCAPAEDLSGASWTLEDWHYARPVAADSIGRRKMVPDATKTVTDSTCLEWGEDVLQVFQARHEALVKFEKRCNDNMRALATCIQVLQWQMRGLTGDSQYLSVREV